MTVPNPSQPRPGLSQPDPVPDLKGRDGTSPETGRDGRPSVRPCPAPGCRDEDGNAALTDKPLCDYHRTATYRATLEMPRLYTELQHAESVTRHNEDRIRLSRTSPIPINVAARSLQNDMLALTGYAEQRLRRHRSWPPPNIHGQETTRIKSRCAFIGRHLDAVLEIDARVGVELLRIKRAARQQLNTRLIHRLPAPCPDCNCMALERADGSSWVRCHYCAISFNEDHYGVLVRVLADANPIQVLRRTPKRSRPRCTARAHTSGLQCRIESDHECSHLAYVDRLNYTDWETWR